jgi:two-component system NarL family sensor kinase
VATQVTPLTRQAVSETERLVAWMRLPAIGLLLLSRTLPHPNPNPSGFYVVLAVFAAWSVASLVWVNRRETDPRFALAATALDVAFITALAGLSGGPYSNARLAYFLIPVTVAFRFRPAVTGIASGATVLAYVIQGLAHPAGKGNDAERFITTYAGYLVWVGAGCVLLSALLARRTEALDSLAEARSQLLADALTAEQRERRSLAEGLHDHAVQNLLSALHELEEAGETSSHPALERAETAVRATVGELREAIFELHPYVLDEVGLEAALRSVAEQAASRSGLELHLSLERSAGAFEHDQLLFSAARELVANVVRHADARRLDLELSQTADEVVLVVADDGRGLDRSTLADRLAGGHIGLASQRVRIEAAGGRLSVESRPGAGTRAEVRLPR